MFSAFLTEALSTPRSEGGAGMSVRPEHYSGRGATTSDLTSERLENLHVRIVKHRGEAAGKAFIAMVQAIPVLSATDFLLALYRLENATPSWTWSPAIVGKENGLYAGGASDGEAHLSALGTVASALGRNGRDETEQIRSAFLSQHGIASAFYRDGYPISYDRRPPPCEHAARGGDRR